MIFKVLKSGLDGISGGNTAYSSIEDALREIAYHKGWNSLAQLRGAIRKWAKHAHPGSVFSTQASAIVAVALEPGVHSDDECTECGHEGMNYTNLDPTEDGSIEQKVSCPECGRRWKDVFVLSERRELSSVGV